MEEIVTGAVPSAARVFKDPTVVNWNFASRPITIYMNTVVVTTIASTQGLIVTGTSDPPIRIRRHDIDSQRGSIGPQKVRNAYPFKTSINQFSPEHGRPTPIFSKLIFRKTAPNEITNIYARKKRTSGENPSSPKVQTSWISGCCPPTHQINSSPSLSALTQLEGRWMVTSGSLLGMILRKLWRKKWARQKCTSTIL